MGSLKQNPTKIEGSAGNSLHDDLQQFKELDPEAQFRKIWQSAGFMRRVSVRIRCRCIHDLNDGFGDRTGSCREYIKSRRNPCS